MQTNRLTAIFITFAAYAFASAAQAQESSALDLLLEQHQKTVETISLTRAAKLSKLNPKYEAALNRIKKQHQADDNFDATIAVAHELKNYNKPPEPNAQKAPGKPSPELTKARATYQKSLDSIQFGIDVKVIAETKDTITKVTALAKKYAATDKFDEAIAADAARKQLQNAESYKTALARAQNSPGAKERSGSGGMAASLPRSGLVAHYQFEGNLHDAEDGSDIFLSGKKSYAAGVAGRAISFDNGYGKEANYVDFPIPKGGNTPFTISFCFQANLSAHSSKSLIGIGTLKTSDIVRFNFHRQGGDQGAIISDRKDNWAHVEGGNSPRPEKQWFHVLITFEPKLLNYYLNGKLVTSLPTKTLFDTTGMSAHIPMQVSMRSNDNGGKDLTKSGTMDCLIDELAIFDRVLRTNEIKSIAESYRLTD